MTGGDVIEIRRILTVAVEKLHTFSSEPAFFGHPIVIAEILGEVQSRRGESAETDGKSGDEERVLEIFPSLRDVADLDLEGDPDALYCWNSWVLDDAW